MLKKLILIFVAAASCFGLSACMLKPYKVPVQQGNILEQKDIAKLYKGMSKNEVRALLGEPVLSDPFSNDNHWTYVYTDQKNGGKIIEKRIEIKFVDGEIRDIDESAKTFR